MYSYCKRQLSHPWMPGEESQSYDGCLYKHVIAETSEGIKFVWKDETNASTQPEKLIGEDVETNARQYGSACNPPMHWGQKQWEEMFRRRR